MTTSDTADATPAMKRPRRKRNRRSATAPKAPAGQGGRAKTAGNGAATAAPTRADKAKAAEASALARGAMVNAGTIAELVAEAAQNTLAANPLIGLRPRDIAVAAGSMLKAVTSAPRKAARQLRSYLKEVGDVVKGDSELAPDPKDRRFADPAWKSNFACKRLMQVYLATQRDLTRFIESTRLDKIDKGRAQFFASLVTDALAPSNCVLGNPVAMRKIVDTGGTNLLSGLRHLVHDVRHNNMLPSQVDATPFKLGENIAASPGRVVLRDEFFELLQFGCSTPQVHKRPLVMSPPQINKYYAIDLSPDKSLIRWTADSGVQLFVVSWRNPTVEQRHWGLTEYAMALDRAVDAARAITGSDDVNMWGSCSGGMTLAAYLGWLADKGDRKVVNTTWAVCVLDMEAAMADTTLGLFNTPSALKIAKARSRNKGIVDGSEMASMFAWLRPNDLIWNYWVNNYLLGNRPPAFDILAWNADTTRLPGQFHVDLLEMVEKNPYVNADTLEIAGVPIDMSKVKVGAYVVGGITDHITPWRACYRTARLLGSETTFVLANAGHLQSLINPPGAPKSFFAAAPANAADPDDWAAAVPRQDGSWWPHWRTWIQERSGELVPAPRKMGSRKFKPLGPAPGEYVFEK
ncbi:MAG TPA: alpha/beta fold hydrolase [Burkholderiaceae bacterium]|nr:alpha/beta fold hydrolase [Burkholderiaceae bacterium]